MVLLSALWVSLLASMMAGPARLEIQLTGLRPGDGPVVVQVYDSPASFLKKPLVSKVVPADAPRLEVAFDLPEGEYAVAAFQDRNGNGVLDKGLFHIPTEPYGLSDHFRPRWSKPRFDDCKFALMGNTVSDIHLK